MKNGPSESFQFFVLDLIPLDVPGYLGYPIVGIFTVLEFFLKGIPVFTVKKFGITEDCYLIFGDGDIRSAGDFFVVLSISDTLMP